MDMLLLTLPEKIMQHCKEHDKDSIVAVNNFSFQARAKGCYDQEHIPTINTFLPSYLQPSTVLADEDMVTNYSTPQLLAIGAKNLLQKTKKNELICSR